MGSLLSASYIYISPNMYKVEKQMKAAHDVQLKLASVEAILTEERAASEIKIKLASVTASLEERNTFFEKCEAEVKSLKQNMKRKEQRAVALKKKLGCFGL